MAWFTKGGTLRRTFGAPRPAGSSNPTRHHAGVDVLVPEGSPVYAPDRGRIMVTQRWPGNQLAVHLRTECGTWVIGGIRRDSQTWRPYQTVPEGFQLGVVGTYPRGSSMLHVEWWEPKLTRRRAWEWGSAPPTGLRNPYAALNRLLAGDTTSHACAELVQPATNTDKPARPNRGRPAASQGPGWRGMAIASGIGLGLAAAVIGYRAWTRSQSRSR